MAMTVLFQFLVRLFSISIIANLSSIEFVNTDGPTFRLAVVTSLELHSSPEGFQLNSPAVFIEYNLLKELTFVIIDVL